MAVKSVNDLLLDELRDIYHAEKQLVKALPKMAKGATSEELREALESHLDETENQVTRLERVFELLDEKPRGKHCAGMAGIVEEGAEKLQEDMEDMVLDACLIASAQKVEHYEMGAYGTVIAWAEALGLNEVRDVLNETLEEEKAADKKLTALAESGINDAATAGESDMEEEEEATTTSRESSRRSEPAGAGAKSARARGGRR